MEKKKEKKNLEWQALKECRAKSRHEGEPQEESPDEDDSNDDDDDDDDSERMAARLDQALQGLPQTDVPSSRAGASKEPKCEPHNERQKEASPHCPCSDLPLPLSRVNPSLHRNPF